MYFLKGFTESGNHAVRLAFQTAEELGHTYVGSEHLLIGLCEEGSGAGESAAEQRRYTGDPSADH